MMSYQRDRDEFVRIMAQEAPAVPAHVVARILRDATTLQRIAELECSSEAADRDRVPCPGAKPKAPAGMCRCDGTDGQHETVPRVTARSARVEHALTAALTPYGVVPVFSGDPRGAVVKLRVASGRSNSWGGDGICVPARG